MNKKSIAGAVLGIIGAVFGIIGSALLSFCAGCVDAVAGSSFTALTYILGLGGAIVGLVGAILDFKKPNIGGALQLLALVMILVVSIVVMFSVWNIIAMVLLLLGGILSFAVQ